MPKPDPLDNSRKRVTLRINERLIADARNLGIDLDAAVDAGLARAG